MKTISIDIETFSDVNLAKCGVYKYAESPVFEILLFGYAVDGGEVQVVDLAQGETVPEDILDALTDEAVTKWAFNASFERICLSRYLSDLGISLDPFHDHHSLSQDCARFLNPAGWKCSMIWSAYMGLPLSLEGVGAVLNLNNQKMKEGKNLIRYFCVPCKENKTNGGRSRKLPHHAPDKWNLFKSYNKRDVAVEMAIQERLKYYPVPEQVWDEYHLDQEINDRGIAIDRTLVGQAVAMDARCRELLMDELKKKTGLENPNSVIQMIAWLEQHGMQTDSLGKKQVQELLKTAEEPLRSVLLLRQKLAKSSVKKYQAMELTACNDSRARGMFQFYGANRTGRFAGRHIQLQNLPQNHLPDLSEARELVRQGNYKALELLYDSIPDVLSQLIRTAFIPRQGMKFVISDFSAIEARVISWLAGETWKSEAFAAGQDIYCTTASQMFGVPVVKHGINGHLRQKGKIAELACG
jgi:DNA polymerase